MTNYFLGKTDQLKLEVEKIISSVDHDLLRGTHAENVLKNFLKETLPKKYTVGTGLVYGTTETGEIIKSKQIDIIIYDGFQNPPLQVFDSFSIFPAEIVYAVIAVKIGLDTTTLLTSSSNCFDNLLSVKQIPKNNYLKTVIAPGIIGGGAPSETLGFVFSFRGDVELDTLVNGLKEKKLTYSNNNWYVNFPDAICVLDKGVIATKPERYELTYNESPITHDFAILEKQALMNFTCLLVSLINKQALMPVDIFKYAYSEAK